MQTIDFGKHEHHNITIEEVFFRDPQYACWMAVGLPPKDYRAQYVKELMAIVSARPIFAKCNMTPGEGRPVCTNTAKYVAIKLGGHSFAPESLFFACEECKNHQPKFMGVVETFLNVRIGFEGLRAFQEQYGLKDHHLHNIARKFAEAFGILDVKGRLTKERIEEFFEGIHG